MQFTADDSTGAESVPRQRERVTLGPVVWEGWSWATTRAMCAISSSTFSRCSSWRRRWQAASSAISTASRYARCSMRQLDWPRVRWPSRSRLPTEIRRRSIRRPTWCRCPSRSRSHCAPGDRASGSESGSTRTSAAWRRRRWWRGRSTNCRWAPTRRYSSTWRAPSWRTSCTTSGANSSDTGRSSLSSGTGPPPWCSPNPTPDPTSALDAPRPSTPATAHGTSTASSGSSPTATPTMCSRTSCIWCSRDPRAPGRAPRDSACSWFPSSCPTRKPASPESVTAYSSPASSTRWG